MEAREFPEGVQGAGTPAPCSRRLVQFFQGGIIELAKPFQILFLLQFRQLGLHFALDDFGSRYANFSMFVNVRFDTVKLDRSLTREMSYNPVCRSLVGNIARICRNQGIQCVAEGVETQAQVNVLLEEGCDMAQGFFYNCPIPMQEFWQKYLTQSV